MAAPEVEAPEEAPEDAPAARERQATASPSTQDLLAACAAFEQDQIGAAEQQDGAQPEADQMEELVRLNQCGWFAQQAELVRLQFRQNREQLSGQESRRLEELRREKRRVARSREFQEEQAFASAGRKAKERRTREAEDRWERVGHQEFQDKVRAILQSRLNIIKAYEEPTHDETLEACEIEDGLGLPEVPPDLVDRYCKSPF